MSSNPREQDLTITGVHYVWEVIWRPTVFEWMKWEGKSLRDGPSFLRDDEDDGDRGLLLLELLQDGEWLLSFFLFGWETILEETS